MGAFPIPNLLTVEDYEQLPDRPGGHRELHHGEAVFVPFPKTADKFLQRRIRKMLEDICEPLGFAVDVEYPYRPLPKHEVWGADVAVLRADREPGVSNWVEGSPELVVDAKSPSSSKAELHDNAMTTLLGEGAVEFWVVDPKFRTVTVFTKSAGMQMYEGGATVPLPFASESLQVSHIFAV